MNQINPQWTVGVAADLTCFVTVITRRVPWEVYTGSQN